jgi:hypothetical protein
MREKITIHNSQFSEEFLGIDDIDIYLFAREESQQIWNKYIDGKSSSFFSLPDSNWLIIKNNINIGNWIEDYNNDIVENVQDIFNKKIDWADSDIVWYCISKCFILETSWFNFKKYWMSFIECEDDCPILLNESRFQQAVLFQPIGNIIRIM